ncbi:hypothetical protein MRX96_004015 [Rhipicephalus microplus]
MVRPRETLRAGAAFTAFPTHAQRRSRPQQRSATSVANRGRVAACVRSRYRAAYRWGICVVPREPWLRRRKVLHVIGPLALEPSRPAPADRTGAAPRAHALVNGGGSGCSTARSPS